MGKVKTAAILILTLCLIVFGALLPVLVAAIQDNSVQNRTGYTGIKSVALELSASQSLSTVEKLILINGNDSYTISENEAEMTSTQALFCAQEHMKLYYEAGLLPYISVTNYQVVPALCVDNNRQAHCIVWAIYLENDGIGNLAVIVDDETGIILSVEYQSYEKRFDSTVEEHIYKIDAFMEIFLSQLTLNEGSINADIAPIYEEAEPGSDYVSRYFSLTDTEGREVVIVFELNAYGSFYTYYY